MYYEIIEIGGGLYQCKNFNKINVAKKFCDFSNNKVYVRKVFKENGKLYKCFWKLLKNKSQCFCYAKNVEKEKAEELSQLFKEE